MVFVKTENGTKIPMKVNLLAVDDLKRHGGVWEDIDRTIDQCFNGVRTPLENVS